MISYVEKCTFHPRRCATLVHRKRLDANSAFLPRSILQDSTIRATITSASLSALLCGRDQGRAAIIHSFETVFFMVFFAHVRDQIRWRGLSVIYTRMQYDVLEIGLSIDSPIPSRHMSCGVSLDQASLWILTLF